MEGPHLLLFVPELWSTGRWFSVRRQDSWKEFRTSTGAHVQLAKPPFVDDDTGAETDRAFRLAEAQGAREAFLAILP